MLQCLFGSCRLAVMRLHRFFVPQPLGENVVVEDISLLHQWNHVFRYSVGDFVILFSGDGFDHHYCIDSLTKKLATLTSKKTEKVFTPSRHITLCLSLIKKDNFEYAVEKATELGVTSILPILSSRSEKKNISVDRLQKIIKEAGEQCGRGDIPTLLPITPLEKALQNIPTRAVAVIFNKGGEPIEKIVKVTENQEIFLFVGPEGGWSDQDLAHFETHSLHQTSLGETMLRAETAAIVGTAFFSIHTTNQ